MPEVDREEIAVLARLARLSLTDDETARLSDQLAEIIDYIRQLQAVSVDGVPEYLPPEQPGSKLRADEAGPTLEPERALAATAVQRDQLVVVPRFKED
jgi:aspartyl-tRNA(Asn)/glutamyl-tRNA(Gln) amidotransferase subunit C